MAKFGRKLRKRVTTVENYKTELLQNTYFRGGGENMNGTISAEWDIDSLNRLSAGAQFTRWQKRHELRLHQQFFKQQRKVSVYQKVIPNL